MKQLIGWVILAGLVTAGLLAQESGTDQPQQLETVYGEADGDVWQPAPTPPGATSWVVLQDLELEERLEGEWVIYDPIFGDKVKALAGERIKINGFMMPLQNAEKQTHFVLMAYPPSCPFHLAGGPSAFIEVKSDEAVAFSYEPVLMEGRFELIQEDEEDSGLFYRMVDARPVKK